MQQRRRENRVTPYEDAELESLAAGMAGKGEVEGVRKILDHREFAEVLDRAMDVLPEAYRTPPQW